MQCDFDDLGNGRWKCKNCRQVLDNPTRPLSPCGPSVVRSFDIAAPTLAQGKPRRSRGIGDTVAKVLETIGIKKKGGCGCSERQKWLNQLLPYKSEIARNGFRSVSDDT